MWAEQGRRMLTSGFRAKVFERDITHFKSNDSDGYFTSYYKCRAEGVVDAKKCIRILL